MFVKKSSEMVHNIHGLSNYFCNMNGEKPSVNIKRNKITEVFEYCMDNGISFQVQERAMGIDEFEVTMEVENIKKAIQLGFFLRENRIELVGSAAAENKTVAKKPAAKKVAETPATVANPLLTTAEPKITSTVTPIVEKTESKEVNAEGEGVSLSFDL